MSQEFNAREFRDTLGLFTTGVTIITCSDPQGRPVGLTANSFSSVSLDPPLILWSLVGNSGNLQTFLDCPGFAVHFLSEDQVGLSNRFARPGDRFADIEYSRNGMGVPLLSNCLARLECSSYANYPGGDHRIFVGQVVRLEHSNLAPLLFLKGKYHVSSRHPQLHAKQTAEPHWGIDSKIDSWL